ncbi:MAG: type II toxin-antitoxin system VapC family toxin [Mycobacteriales bacterium]
MIVVDASVLVSALIDDSAVGKAAHTALGRDDHWAGPEHVITETAAAIRGSWLAGKLTQARVAAALEFLSHAEITRIHTAALLPRAWELRDNLTTYDACYVAAAEHLDVPLLTPDRRLSNAPGIRCALIVP